MEVDRDVTVDPKRRLPKPSFAVAYGSVVLPSQISYVDEPRFITLTAAGGLGVVLADVIDIMHGAREPASSLE